MKNLNSKQVKAALVATSVAFLSSGAITANAGTVKSVGSAVSLCKTLAKANNSDYKGSKLMKAKRIKKGYLVRLKVLTEQGKSVAQCNIQKDGSIDYSVI